MLLVNPSFSITGVGSPGSSTDKAIPTWNGIAGNLLANSGVFIKSSNVIWGTDAAADIGSEDAGVTFKRPRTSYIAIGSWLGDINNTSSTFDTAPTLNLVSERDNVNARIQTWRGDGLGGMEGIAYFYPRPPSGSLNESGWAFGTGAYDTGTDYVALTTRYLVMGNGSLSFDLRWQTDGLGDLGINDAGGFQRPNNVYVKTAVNSPLYAHQDSATNNNSAAQSVTVRAANKTAGTGNGGTLNLSGGTSAGGTKGAVGISASRLSLTRASAAGDATISANITFHAVTGTSGAALTLPDANAFGAGSILEIKDEGGAAGTSSITVSRAGSNTIDGVTSVVISVNFGVLRLYSNGTNWFTR